MLENQFITFTETIPTGPEVAMQAKLNQEMRFFIDAQAMYLFKIVNHKGGNISTAGYQTNFIGSADGKNLLTGISVTSLQDKQLYRIKLEDIDNQKTYYSNLLINDTDADISVLEYRCKEPAFGFPFGNDIDTGVALTMRNELPIKLYSPQFKQEDKIYTKRNGEQVVLFANITKEYEGETDYIPMEWHEKILMALSCDDVYINGERVTKSGNYEIDHDNCTYSDCGIKLLRATFKVTTNVTQRNSNY